MTQIAGLRSGMVALTLGVSLLGQAAYADESQQIDFQAMGWASACVTCHGATTQALPGQVIPPIAGRPVDEFLDQMQRFHQSDEPGVLMTQITRGYDADVLRRIAQWYEQQGTEAATTQGESADAQQQSSLQSGGSDEF